MIRILHIINGADLGGISTLILNYYRAIDRNAVHFDCACTGTTPLGYNGKALQALGASFFQLPLKSKHPIRHTAALRRLLRLGDYDAIHVHCSLTSFWDLAVAKHTGIHIRVSHSHSAELNKHSFFQDWKHLLFTALNRRYATDLLACSRDAALFAYGEPALDDPRTMILPNAVDCQRFCFREEHRRELRAELGIPPEAFVYGSVGRLSPEKNLLFLIRLLPNLLSRRPDTRLLLVGDGTQRREAEELTRRLGLSGQVIFTGQRSDVDRLLNAMDTFVVSSIHEGFCIAALEAGVNGLPLVLSDGVPKDLLFFSNAVSLSLNDAQSRWCSAILSGASRDPHGPEKAEARGFDIHSSVKKLETMYRRSLP